VLVDYDALLLRVALALMFIAHAWLKIKVFTPAGAVKYFESLGVPGFLAYLTIAAEIAGGTLLLLGIETRWVALLLVPLIAGTIELASSAHRAIVPQSELDPPFPPCRPPARIVSATDSERNISRLA